MFYSSNFFQRMGARDHFKNRASSTSEGDKMIFAPKKVLFLALCIIAISCNCLAQDIIVTKDARKINAKVTEVNVDNVRYKNFDNQDGPVYTLLKSDIASIVYQNGQVDTFTSESSTPAAPTQTPRQRVQAGRTPIESSGNLLTDMQTYSPALYSQYVSGKKLATTGWIFLGSGVAANIVGILMFTADENILGTAWIVAGEIFLATSVPLLIIGGSRKNRSVRTFNSQYQITQSDSPHFQMNVYPNRVGIAYVF